MGAFGLLLAAAPAAYAGNIQGTDGGNTLTIDLKGTVLPRCGFKTPPPSSANVSDLTTAGTLSAGFVLDCNTPFRLRVSSQNGDLALQNAPAEAQGAFGQTDPYELEVQFKTDLSTVDETCPSVQLTSQAGGCDFYGSQTGQGVSSGNGVAIGQQGSLNFSWTAPAATLVAGQYSDTITIVVEART